MADLVVSLYAPVLDALARKVATTDMTIRPVLAPEQRLVVDWVRGNFSNNWASGFFGPTGVAVDARGQGIGAALLHSTLQTMKNMGYAYAIVGDPGPTQFYIDTVGAIEIPLPGKGIYADMLRAPAR
jgi:GNAT superfamily N-acetyltransferase